MKLLVLALAAASLKEAVLESVNDIRPRMIEVNQAIWSYAEPGLEETRSSKELQGFLQENGFTVRAHVAGMSTAFVASYGSGKPVIALLAEYDALLGVSQKAVPRREPREDPAVVAGHGCGHSVFGTGTTAAAIAMKRVMQGQKLPGTVRLYGTPAEETVDAKTFMLREGLFEDVDVVLSWHASDRTGATYSYSKAVTGLRFTFDGLAAHASTSPHQGRSALDAIELMNVGASLLIHENLERVGPPRFDEKEKAFARETQKDLGFIPEGALFEGIDPVPDTPGQRASSTDQGDLSWHVPTGGLVVASYALGAPGHSWQVAACTGMSIGEKAMTVAAQVLAATGIDLLTEPALLEEARESFRRVRDPLSFRSLLPEDMKAPASIRK